MIHQVTNLPDIHYRLLHQGRLLDEYATLNDYDVKQQDTLMIIGKLGGGGPAPKKKNPKKKTSKKKQLYKTFTVTSDMDVNDIDLENMPEFSHDVCNNTRCIQSSSDAPDSPISSSSLANDLNTLPSKSLTMKRTLKIQHESQVYTYECELAEALRYWMEIRTQSIGDLYIATTPHHLLPTQDLSKLPILSLNYITTTDTTDNDIQDYTCNSGQSHIRILYNNVHGLQSSYPQISRMMEEKEIGIFMGFDCIAKHDKNVGRPFERVVNDQIKPNMAVLLQ